MAESRTVRQRLSSGLSTHSLSPTDMLLPHTSHRRTQTSRVQGPKSLRTLCFTARPKVSGILNDKKSNQEQLLSAHPCCHNAAWEPLISGLSRAEASAACRFPLRNSVHLQLKTEPHLLLTQFLQRSGAKCTATEIRADPECPSKKHRSPRSL